MGAGFSKSKRPNLLTAVREGDLRTVQRILKSSLACGDVINDTNVSESDVDDNTPLAEAVSRIRREGDKFYEIAKLLLSQPNIAVNQQNNKGKTALHAACGYGINSHVGAQLLLSDARCDVNVLNSDDNTPLMTAVRKVTSHDDVHAKVVKLLLQHDSADINVTNNAGDGVEG